MLRKYPQYPNRTIHDLDGFWEFCFSEEADPQKPVWDDVVFSESAAVPGVFDMLPGAAGRRGTGFYRTTVRTQKRHLLLHLHGADSAACVQSWMNIGVRSWHGRP